jgi:hypothetical protein
MDDGSLTFRIARTLAAAALGALRSLVVLVLVLAIALPLLRIAASWYVRGTLDFAPAPAAQPTADLSALVIRGADARESSAVRAAIASLRYRVDPRAVSIVVVDQNAASPGSSGEFLPYLDIIQLQRDVVDGGGLLLRWTVAHEIGHYVDQRYLTAATRQRFRQLRHIPPGLTWEASDQPWERRPDEDFAEVFAALSVPAAFTPPATVYGPVRDPLAYEALLRRSGVVLGRLPKPTTWVDVLTREYGLARDAVTDPRLSRLLLFFVLVYVALGALPPALRAWRRSSDAEGVPRLDSGARRVLNTGRLVPHKTRSGHVSHQDRDHGGGG